MFWNDTLQSEGTITISHRAYKGILFCKVLMKKDYEKQMKLSIITFRQNAQALVNKIVCIVATAWLNKIVCIVATAWLECEYRGCKNHLISFCTDGFFSLI